MDGAARISDDGAMAETGMKAAAPAAPALARRLGLFDAVMLVMGGIIGAGIFINPYVVAQRVHTPALILGAWAAGGVVALLGAFAYAELAQHLPTVGGQYAYLREAFHPAVAFVYGWALLLVIQTGGMAAVAVTFGHYVRVLAGGGPSAGELAALALAGLTAINCLGVRGGSNVQSALMLLKLAAIAGLVAAGAWLLPAAGTTAAAQAYAAAGPGASWLDFGAAMTAVLFAYGGWQTATFLAGEMREPRRDLPRGLVLGVLGVVAVYLAVNAVTLRALGPAGLAHAPAPAAAVMRRALGRTGEVWIAAGIALSALGFLSQSMLTAPRVYFAMASDGLFFRALAGVNRRTRAPMAAILLQGAWAIVIAASGHYAQILNYVVATDFVFFGLTAASIFILRRRLRREGKRLNEIISARMPGHPWTTLAFIAACWSVVLATLVRYPRNSALGWAIDLAGIPIYLLWKRKARLSRKR